MSFQDKPLQCHDCGEDYVFTVGEQEEFASKGYTNVPKRCPACRQARQKTSQRTAVSSFAQVRQRFPAVCVTCGKSTEVPFQPRGDKPVYCGDCYRKIRSSR